MGVGLPLAIVSARCFLWKPLRTLLFIGGLTWIWPHLADRVFRPFPALHVDGAASQAAGLGIVAGMPLAWAAHRAWQRRKRSVHEYGRSRLAQFESWAGWTARNLSRSAPLSDTQRHFIANIESGLTCGRLATLLDEGRTGRFFEQISHFEDVLRGIERLDRQAKPPQAERPGGTADPYEVLMCEPESSYETIKQAYKSYCRHYHPDAVKGRGGDIEIAHRKMQEGNLAFAEIKHRRGMQ